MPKWEQRCDDCCSVRRDWGCGEGGCRLGVDASRGGRRDGEGDRLRGIGVVGEGGCGLGKGLREDVIGIVHRFFFHR